MNQNSRQKSTSSVETYKLLNNSNLGIHCRNNIDNCVLQPLFDHFEEISYIKKFTSILFDETYRHFYSPALVREEIISTFETKIFELSKEDLIYKVRKCHYENKMAEELDAANSFEINRKIKKKKIENIDEKTTDCLYPRKTKMLMDFNNREPASIKSFAVKKRQNQSHRSIHVWQTAHVCYTFSQKLHL